MVQDDFWGSSYYIHNLCSKVEGSKKKIGPPPYKKAYKDSHIKFLLSLISHHLVPWLCVAAGEAGKWVLIPARNTQNKHQVGVTNRDEENWHWEVISILCHTASWAIMMVEKGNFPKSFSPGLTHRKSSVCVSYYYMDTVCLTVYCHYCFWTQWFNSVVLRVNTHWLYHLPLSDVHSALMFGFSQHDKKWGNENNILGAFRVGNLPTGLNVVERVASGMLTPANSAIKIQAVNLSKALKFLDPVISLLGINQKEIISIYKATLCTQISSAQLFITLQKN